MAQQALGAGLIVPRKRALFGLRFLDLHHHLALGEDRLRGGDDRRAGSAVLIVAGADADPGAAFDPHLVAVLDQLLGAFRRQADPVFLVLDLARAADQHGCVSSGGSLQVKPVPRNPTCAASA